MEPNKGKNIILKIIAIILVLADIFLVVWFVPRNMIVSLALVGVLIIGLLISTTIHSIKAVKHVGYRIGMIFIPIGVLTFFGILTILILKTEATFSETLFLTIEIMPLFIGIAVILNRIVYKLTKKKYCTFPVTTLCSGISTKRVSGNGSNRTAVKAGTFKFLFDGEEYTVQEDTYSFTNQPKKGGDYTIYIDPDNVEDIYFPNKMGDITNYITGLLFIAYDVVFFAATVAMNL